MAALAFDRSYYLEHNPDVAANGIDPLTHYDQFGAREGRSPNAYFDEGYYLHSNPDVAAAVKAGLLASGFQHYLLYGDTEGRSPTALFDEQYYLTHNADVANAISSGTQIEFEGHVLKMNGYLHFLKYGQFEHRDPVAGFDEGTYLTDNPDVAAAVAQGAIASGWEHFEKYGKFELHRDGVDISLFVPPANTNYIVGDSSNNLLIGTAANDVIKGDAGNDTIYYTSGNDNVYGDAGDDWISHSSNEGNSPTSQNVTIHGGAGDDRIETAYYDPSTPQPAGDYTAIMYGDAGNDRFYLQYSTSELYHTNYQIMDFHTGQDTIVITGSRHYGAFNWFDHFQNGFSDLLQYIHNDSSGNAVISFLGSDHTTIMGVAKESLVASDFTFS